MEQLLLRESITLDSSNIESYIRGKRIMITGAAGSIGSELLKQILRFQPKLVVAIDQSEDGISILSRIYARHDNLYIKLRNITDAEDMKSIFCEFGPEIVFHTAAYKHVDVLEKEPVVAIKNNIFGTELLADLSIQSGVEKFVFVSTDKAVHPLNVMGITKRICELYLHSLKTPTQFITTRFGNVLGSSGSVYTIFLNRIKDNKPLEITHPDVTRYFITIPESVLLVLEAAVIGKSGEVMIFEMGNPVLIVELAHRMFSQYQKPGQCTDIVFTGLKPGEKLHEDLQYPHEKTNAVHQGKIRVISSQYKVNSCVREGINNLRHLVNTSTNPELLLSLKNLL